MASSRRKVPAATNNARARAVPSSNGKLTDEVRQKLIMAIRSGNYVSVAARFAGIHPSTFWSWMRKGRRAKRGKYREFYDEVRNAETYAEVMAVASIHKHMKDNWRAAVTYLERKFPKRWTTGGKRLSPSAESRRGLPVAVRLKHDAAFLGEVAHVLDQSGALESVVGSEALTAAD